jgi:hypothetical protein
MKPLAIPLTHQKTVAKRLVISRLVPEGGTQQTQLSIPSLGVMIALVGLRRCQFLKLEELRELPTFGAKIRA